MKLHNALKNIALPSLFLWSFCVATVQAEAAPVNVTALNYVEAKTAIQFDKYLASAGASLIPLPIDVSWLVSITAVVSA